MPQSDVFTLDFDALTAPGRVRDIGFLLGPGSGGNALALANVTAERIAVTSGPATQANQGVRLLSDAVLRDSSIDVRGEGARGLVIGSLVEGDYLAEDVTITSGGTGVLSGPQPGSNGQLSRVHVTAAASALQIDRSPLRVASSLLEGADPVRVSAMHGDAALLADHATLATTGPLGLDVTGANPPRSCATR